MTECGCGAKEAVRNKHTAIVIFVVCLVLVAALAWYQSLPRPNGGPASPTARWTEYVLTKNGNHTQLQASYSSGQVNTEEILWLNFDNRTAVYNYFGCTPSSMPGCTLDGCAFSVLNDTASEYRVKVYCEPGA